jgi:hypothetical protein
MRFLIKTFIFLVICFIAVGFYEGWISFSRTTTVDEQGDNKVNYNVSVDKDKMKADVKKVKEEIKEIKEKKQAKEATH